MKSLSPSLHKLVKVLNDGEFHSGAAIGEILKISRNAVWKHINQLTKYEIDIISAQSKGYCLKQPLSLLDKRKIKKQLTYSGKFYPNHIELLGSVSSTNDYLKLLPINNPNEIIICLAEHQTAGRGRFGRTWYSPFAANIYLSCRWCISKDSGQLNGLSLVVALAVISALKELNIKNDLSVKWPNDILWQGQKLGGILTEITAESHGLTQIIIGIGLNVNMPVNTEAPIDGEWTALTQILQQHQDRNKIAGVLITHLLHNLEKFNDAGFAAFAQQWQQYDDLCHKKINLTLNQNNILGIAKGVNEHGHLLIQDNAGALKAYCAGEATLHAAHKAKD